MGVLLISRPKTGREFSTGIQLGAMTFKKLTAALSTAFCAYCRAEHLWTAREARFVEAIPERRWVERFQSTGPGESDKP
jgi:hypothetical protein